MIFTLSVLRHILLNLLLWTLELSVTRLTKVKEDQNFTKEFMNLNNLKSQLKIFYTLI